MIWINNSYNFGISIPTDNLVLYNRFNNSITDETGNHTLSGTGAYSYGVGLYNGNANESILFNAVGEYLEVPDSDLLSFGDGSTDSSFSVSFSINIDSFSPANLFIISKRGLFGVASNVQREWQVYIRSSDQKIIFVLWDESSGAYIGKIGNTALSTSTNYTYVLTYDGSASSSGIKIYKDGSLEGLTDLSSGAYTAMENGTSKVTIGCLADSTVNRFWGKLDYLGVWDKELTSGETTAIYNKQSSGNELL